MDHRDRGLTVCPHCGDLTGEDMAGECCAAERAALAMVLEIARSQARLYRKNEAALRARGRALEAEGTGRLAEEIERAVATLTGWDAINTYLS